MTHPPPRGFAFKVNGERVEEEVILIDGDLQYLDVIDANGKRVRVYGAVDLVETNVVPIRRRGMP